MYKDEYLKELMEIANFIADGHKNDKNFDEKLQKMKTALSEKERLVLKTRFPGPEEGFRDDKETAKLLNMSVDEVQELEISAYRKLRNVYNN